ncbi:PREDICTED: uncharacterized protein LOC105359422 [Ceratosolen solmsi marchali]|uniref:Uncharacterized protein LOC105359422 n=1 Tax=Ceratosolen solmsi marchali TaxID=326594 RepID=A0AAJ6VLV2_9HYME|nr:PREDICTED: uncharacterized protein LOC105359422 [Ceratosolen solmsi marchali]
MANKCKECGCTCKQCNKYEQMHNDMHLHVEIENLRQRLVERDNHIVTMETQFLNEAEKFPNGELASLKEEMIIWQDKYTRLYESHKRIQKVNQNLEDKLLKIVDKCETEKGAFTKDIATLSIKLADANYSIHQLTQDNEKYRRDIILATQLLQCKPSNFVGQKYESLPSEVQAKVRTYVTQKNHISEIPNTDIKSITVPISTFPPTAMVYNVAKPIMDKQDINNDDNEKSPIDMVSAAIMAKVLEDREKERIFARHCNTCTCHRNVLKVDNESQTTQAQDENIKDMNLNCSKGYSLYNNLNVKHDTYHCSSGTVESTLHMDNENFKISCRNSTNDNTYLNFTNSHKNRSITNEVNIQDKSKSINEVARMEIQSSLNNYEKSISEAKLAKEMENFDELLWKSNWINSKGLQNTNESETKLDVINEKSPPLSVSDVKNSNYLIKNEKMQPESTSSPSFGDSEHYQPVFYTSKCNRPSTALVHVAKSSRSDRSTSISNDENASCTLHKSAQMQPESTSSPSFGDSEHHRSVLYTSGYNRHSTALVHVAKSSRSDRSTSISNDENASCTLHENVQMQRVAEWINTITTDSSQLENNSLSSEIEHQPDLITFESFSDFSNNASEKLEEIYLSLKNKDIYQYLDKSK